ncbi:MAG: alpha/beta fold hydrolase [Spirochaetota bacterium]
MTAKLEIRLHPEDENMRKIISNCSSITAGYKPTFWCSGTFAQLLWLLIKEQFNLNSVRYKRHPIVFADGGSVCIDIAESEELQETSPIVFFLHTITGSSQTTNGFVKYALRRGWRAIVLNRRGHEHSLTSPKFNLMGDIDDTIAMIRQGKSLFPQASYAAAIGISAGSGQVVSYIGRQREKVDISAAVSICPAYDVSTAFTNLDTSYPKVSALLLKRVKKYFLENNRQILQKQSGFEESLRATKLQEIFQSLSSLAGAEDWQDYLTKNNPMAHYKGNQIPCLVLNSLDDPVCVKDNIPDLREKNYAVVLTRYGSHVAYAEGISGFGSWMERVSMDFLDTCMRLGEEKTAAKTLLAKS